MEWSMYNTLVQNLLFFMCLFLVRKVSLQFRAGKELQVVCLILAITFNFNDAALLFMNTTNFVVLGYFIYIYLFASLMCLYFTALEPIADSYETSQIIPFSLNQECLTNFESAVIQETSSQYFFDYLSKDLKSKRGVTLFALYADLRRFMILCDEKHRLEQLE